jgi:PadR family transcriptional regulator, regulatory protein PadR
VKISAEHAFPPHVVPKNYLVAWILVLLQREHLHGYELTKELRDEFGIVGDPGTVYRVLRQLEAEQLIRSQWSEREGGPARRVYELTDAGRAALGVWSAALADYSVSLEKFFRVYHGLNPQ